MKIILTPFTNTDIIVKVIYKYDKQNYHKNMDYDKQCSLKSVLANRRRNDDTLGAHTTLSGRLFIAFTTIRERYLVASVE